MTWLKKVGTIILRATEIIVGFGPTAAALIPGDKDDKAIKVVSDTLVQIKGVVEYAEVFGQALALPGTQKLTGAAPAVAQIILQSAVMAKHEIADREKFLAGCTQIAAGMADLLNSLKDKVETENKA